MLLYNSYCSIVRGPDDNALETPWVRGINTEETSRERDKRSNSSLGSLCKLSKIKNNTFKRRKTVQGLEKSKDSKVQAGTYGKQQVFSTDTSYMDLSYIL